MDVLEKAGRRDALLDALKHALQQPNACLNKREVAAILGVSQGTVDVWRKANAIPEPMRLGGFGRTRIARWRVKDLIAWLEEHS
jgi:predicted DNA-binding transcriptional regulator AlpA